MRCIWMLERIIRLLSGHIAIRIATPKITRIQPYWMSRVRFIQRSTRITIVAKGCTTPLIHPPYGFTFSKSCPIETSRCHSCGPAKSSNRIPSADRGATTVAAARTATLFTRGAPVTCTSANGDVALSAARTPTRKYLLFATAHANGPACRTRSPGSGLRKSTRSAPARSGFIAYARWRWSSVVSASCDVKPVGRSVRRNVGCARPSARQVTAAR